MKHTVDSIIEYMKTADIKQIARRGENTYEVSMGDGNILSILPQGIILRDDITTDLISWENGFDELDRITKSLEDMLVRYYEDMVKDYEWSLSDLGLTIHLDCRSKVLVSKDGYIESIEDNISVKKTHIGAEGAESIIYAFGVIDASNSSCEVK